MTYIAVGLAKYSQYLMMIIYVDMMSLSINKINKQIRT